MSFSIKSDWKHAGVRYSLLSFFPGNFRQLLLPPSPDLSKLEMRDKHQRCSSHVVTRSFHVCENDTVPARRTQES
ncbi:hypothetical protein ElyMa_004517800 [Elysia marginata]|uniref:Uncharacterized protein n=1 Tax=Elysia marginata TaxID=1093978 RepID=A0AAV4HLI4_9GAST|nr:hypothetical protein ElyMa_004517800 [Elysia marginata]